jgi:hypothetical protein
LIFELWSRVRPFILPSIAELNGTHTEDDVLVMLLAGKAKLWAGEKCAVVTEFVTYPQLKALNIWMVGGDLQEILNMEDEQIIPFAKENGCTRLTGGGRKGWSKIGPRTDWNMGGVFMYKDL